MFINWHSKGPCSIHCTSTMWYHTLKKRIQTIAHTSSGSRGGGGRAAQWARAPPLVSNVNKCEDRGIERASPFVSNSMILNKCEDTGWGLSLYNSNNSADHMYYIYVMATNASCTIIIEDQVGSANDFTCIGRMLAKRVAQGPICRP